MSPGQLEPEDCTSLLGTNTLNTGHSALGEHDLWFTSHSVNEPKDAQARDDLLMAL